MIQEHIKIALNYINSQNNTIYIYHEETEAIPSHIDIVKYDGRTDTIIFDTNKIRQITITNNTLILFGEMCIYNLSSTHSSMHIV